MNSASLPGRAASAAVLVLVFALACGDGGGGASSPLPFSELEQQALQAVCQAEVGCGSMPDLATCLSTLHTKPGYYPTLADDIAAGRVAYDGSAARRCLDRLGGLGCQRSTYPTGTASDPDCLKALAGTVPAGGPCFFYEECAGARRCTKTDSACTDACCPGTCAPPPIAVGGDCSAAGALCVVDATCGAATAGASAHLCVALPAILGADCSVTKVCALPLICVTDATTQAMTCTNAAATGGGCRDGALPCDDVRDACDTASRTCQRRGAVGASCTTLACVAYASCDDATKICVARGRIGEPCTPACLDGLTCDPTTQLCVGPAPDAPACQ